MSERYYAIKGYEDINKLRCLGYIQLSEKYRFKLVPELKDALLSKNLISLELKVQELKTASLIQGYTYEIIVVEILELPRRHYGV